MSWCLVWLKIRAVLIAFNKPFGVLSQFTGDGSPNRALAEFHFPKNVYPIGRLDADSEGLLLLSDEPEWNESFLHPRHAHEREYWAQVEKIPTPECLKQLGLGISIQGRKTLPVPRVAAGTATGNSTARAADPFSQKRAGLLDWSGIDRRQKPPGAAHDGGHRASDVALAARADWRLEAGQFGSGQMENSFTGRTRVGLT